MTAMIKLRHQQPSLWHRGLAKDIEGLWEPWMRLVDELLEDEQLLDTVYEAQGERHPQSRIRGRMQTPAEVLLRLLLLKHIRNWSYDVVEREVRANLVYRAFTRIGDEKVPDAKTLARLGQVIGPEVIRNLHQRLMELARERGIVEGRRMRGEDRRAAQEDSRPHAHSEETSDGDCVGDPPARAATRGAPAETIRPTSERDAKDSESGPRRDGGSGASCTASPQAGAEGEGNIGTHGRASAAGGEANQGPDLPGNHAFSRQDRERVRAAHGNHSQRQSQ